MTILQLNRLWLNRMDTGEGISGASGRMPSTSYAMDGAVRTYSSGRRRAFSTTGLKVEVPRQMVALDYATKELLVTWLGVYCLMRDYRGGKWHGVFYDVAVSEYMRSDLYAATITLLVTTTDEVA